MKDYIINDVPATYTELVKESIKINNYLYKRRIERGGWSDNYNPSRLKGKGNTQRSTNHYGDPIDLDAI